MNKKAILIALFIVVVLFLVLSYPPSSVTSKNWYIKDGNNILILRLNKNKSFSYKYKDKSTNVFDYTCKRYFYLIPFKTFYVKCNYGTKIKTIDVVDYNERNLKVKINGEEKQFYSSILRAEES